MAHFILVHGMFHGGWCFDRLARRLEADGHTVDAPDLAGCGTDPTPAASVTLAGWADDIARRIAAAPAPVVLVGHSRGGMVISQAAEQAGEGVAVLVYLTALMLPNGATAAEVPQIMARHGHTATPLTVMPRLSEDGTMLLPPVDAADLFYAGCSAEDRDWGVPQLGGEPIASMMTPMTLTQEGWGRVPRVYIETTEDRSLPIAAQRALVAEVGAAEVLTLDADHMPILTHVAELAGMLEDIAARYAPADAVTAA